MAYACGQKLEPRLGDSGALLKIDKGIVEQVGAMEEDVLLGEAAAQNSQFGRSSRD